MDQRTIPHAAAAADRYGEVALGVECAWPQLTGAPTAVQGLVIPSSSSPKRDPGVGAALSLVAALLLGTAPSASADIVESVHETCPCLALWCAPDPAEQILNLKGSKP
jgi:hypothetical protein